MERMHASRTTYRSELSHVEEQMDAPAADVFPRSETFKFVKRHPYYASLGLIAALSIMPRMRLRRAVKSGAALATGMLGEQRENFSDAPRIAINGAHVAVPQPWTMNSPDPSKLGITEPVARDKISQTTISRGFPSELMILDSCLLGCKVASHLCSSVVYLLLN